jgi:hypothetical protein
MQTNHIPSSESHVQILSLRLFIQRIFPSPRLTDTFHLIFKVGVLTPSGDYPLPFVHGCLLNISAATLHSWRPSLYL